MCVRVPVNGQVGVATPVPVFLILCLNCISQLRTIVILKKRDAEAELMFQRSQAIDAVTASFSSEYGGNLLVT